MSERLSIEWSGTDGRGIARGARGSYTLAEVAAITERYFRRGWKSLTVATGPLGDEGRHEIARIGPHPDTGERIWWAETDESAVRAQLEPPEPPMDTPEQVADELWAAARSGGSRDPFRPRAICA